MTVMHTRIPLVKFISLGQNLWFLLNPQFAQVQPYFQGIRDFTELLEACDLPQTRQAANTLANINIIYSVRGTPLIDQPGVNYFQAMMAPIRDCLFAEAGRMELIAVRSGAVSQQLGTLPSIRALKTIRSTNC
jgi:hypothetical protein